MIHFLDFRHFKILLLVFFIFMTNINAQSSSTLVENSSVNSAGLFWTLIAGLLLQTILILFLIVLLRKYKKEKSILRNVIDCFPTRIFWKDQSSNFLGCNESVAKDAGKTYPSELIGKSDKDMVWHQQASTYKLDDQKVMKTGKAKINYEELHKSITGGKRWVSTSKTPLRNDQGKIYGVMGTYEDISHRKNIEEELKLSEEKLRMITANIPGVVYQFYAKDDGQWGLHYISERSEKIFGLKRDTETFLEQFIENIHDEDKERFIQSINKSIQGMTPWHFEGRYIKSDNSLVYFYGDSIPVQHKGELVFYGILYDVTAKKKIEAQLHHSQKMDAVGKLAGGIAHDFNNMLGGILMAAEVLDSYLKDAPEGQRFQQIIIDSAHHAANLTKQLLAFSRKQPASPKNINFHTIINDVVVILNNTVDKRITIETDLQAPNPIIKGDASYLQNAILNLGINASHAMPKGGKIELNTKNIELSEPFCQKQPFDIDPGKYLEINISDTGHGINEQDLQQIFEPFFTTKKQGVGTGLGLASVYATTKQHNGSITVQSTPDKGTCVTILFPSSSEKEEQQKKPPSLYHGNGHILLVDDEEVMRITGEALLGSIGYEVSLAKNGREGIEIFSKNPHSFDLVILDMIMPVMNGRDCFFKMKKIRPDIPVILASGYSPQEDIKEMEAQGLDAFLRKPFKRNHLSQCIRQIIKK